jgi:uncharacterized membrane protein
MTLKSFLQGRFMGHPLHPALVHLPVGLWVASWISDLLARGSAGDVAVSASFSGVALYCIGLGLAGAFLAAPTGIAEWMDIPRGTAAKRTANLHFALNVLLIAGYFVQLFLRSAETEVSPSMLLFNTVQLVVLGISGYLGGVLAYRHGIGVRHRHSALPPETRIPDQPLVRDRDRAA